jgi:hypothetical protein
LSEALSRGVACVMQVHRVQPTPLTPDFSDKAGNPSAFDSRTAHIGMLERTETTR